MILCDNHILHVICQERNTLMLVKLLKFHSAMQRLCLIKSQAMLGPFQLKI